LLTGAAMPPGAGETISYQILSSVSRTVLDCADKRTVMRGCANSRGGLTLRPDLNDRYWPKAAVENRSNRINWTSAFGKSGHLRSVRESDDCGSFAGIILDPHLPHSKMLSSWIIYPSHCLSTAGLPYRWRLVPHTNVAKLRNSRGT